MIIIPDESRSVDGIIASVTAGGSSMELTGDCINDGDQLTCPVHKDEIIYTFESGWWTKNGGTLHEQPSLNFFCSKCSKHISAHAWSYGG